MKSDIEFVIKGILLVFVLTTISCQQNMQEKIDELTSPDLKIENDTLEINAQIDTGTYIIKELRVWRKKRNKTKVITSKGEIVVEKKCNILFLKVNDDTRKKFTYTAPIKSLINNKYEKIDLVHEKINVVQGYATCKRNKTYFAIEHHWHEGYEKKWIEREGDMDFIKQLVVEPLDIWVFVFQDKKGSLIYSTTKLIKD